MATQLARSSAYPGGAHSSASPSDSERHALRDLLAQRTFKRGEFTLSSGARSRMYFDMKATMMHPQGAALCARLLLEKIVPLAPDFIGGLEMGAVPLLGTVAAYSHDEGHPIPAIFIRKAAKAHGTALMIEGLDDTSEALAGKTVMLVDDVATSGNSVLQAVEEIAAAGGKVTDAIVILDREQGAAELLRSKGIRLHALFTATDLGVTEADRAPLA